MSGKESKKGLIAKAKKAGSAGVRLLSTNRCRICGEEMEYVVTWNERERKLETAYDHACDEKIERQWNSSRKGERAIKPIDASKTFADKLKDAELICGLYDDEDYEE